MQREEPYQGLTYCRSSRNRRVPSGIKTAGDKPEEGEDDVKSACPLCPGPHTCYNGGDKESQTCEG
eukprot:scaffold41491_cov5843-Isochrysis_galbana.AAC.1